MFNARDCAFANFLMELALRDLQRFGPGQPISWGWTSVLLWMSEELASQASCLQTPDATRQDMLALSRSMRDRVREARRSLRSAA